MKEREEREELIESSKRKQNHAMRRWSNRVEWPESRDVCNLILNTWLNNSMRWCYCIAHAWQHDSLYFPWLESKSSRGSRGDTDTRRKVPLYCTVHEKQAHFGTPLVPEYTCTSSRGNLCFLTCHVYQLPIIIYRTYWWLVESRSRDVNNS